MKRLFPSFLAAAFLVSPSAVVVNALSQTGPVGKLITVQMPPSPEGVPETQRC